MLLNIWMITSVVIYFNIFPITWVLIEGDWAYQSKNWDEANQYYQTVLRQYPKNKPVLYSVTQTYLKQEKYEKALPYLIKAYNIDPVNWVLEGLRQIPETLIKLQRYDEAIQWCDKIIEENSERENICEVMNEIKRGLIERD